MSNPNNKDLIKKFFQQLSESTPNNYSEDISTIKKTIETDFCEPLIQLNLNTIVYYSIDLLKSHNDNAPDLGFRLLVHPTSRRQLWKVFLHSRRLSQLLLKNPILWPTSLESETTEEFKTNLKHSLDLAISPSSKLPLNQEFILKKLREIKVTNYLKILIADLEKYDNFEDTIQKISIFAQTNLQKVFEITRLDQHQIAAIAMGKLGGMELNYQSDIDLMFVITEGLTNGEKQTIEKKIKQLINYFQKLTSDGLLYKMDMQIRPNGNSGALFLTVKQYKDYYSNRALEWEYQALIKASWIAGDIPLGDEFKELKQTLIFRERYSNKHMLLQMSEMKDKIETHFKQTDYSNIKLGPGGIRDIEFIVQFLQILHGKLTPSLNDSNTLSTLTKLHRYHAISNTEYQTLRHHYIYLRQIEHYLQTYELSPIRSLPKKEENTFSNLSYLMEQRNSIQDTQNSPPPTANQLDSLETTANFNSYHQKIRLENCRLFSQLFSITTAFSEKLADLTQKIISSELDNDLLEHYTANLESDYFLAFNTHQILSHFRLFLHISEEQPTQIEITPDKSQEKLWYLTIITPDQLGAFSMLCGLVSSFGLNIQDGASFVYSPNANYSSSSLFHQKAHPSSLKNVFRQKSFLPTPKTPEKTNSPIIICSMRMNLNTLSSYKTSRNKNHPLLFDPLLLQKTILEYCNQLNKTTYPKLMENISIKIISLIKKNAESYLKPIGIHLDNDRHPLYNILEIESEDSFLFLYHFTQAIATKNFYLIKIAFSTKNGMIKNQLFITNQYKEKIQTQSRLEELKTTILIIKYFSFYLTKAPNPQLALKQFTKIIHEFSQDYEQTFQDLLNHGPWFDNLAKILGTSENFIEDFVTSQSPYIKKYFAQKEDLNLSTDLNYLKEKVTEYMESAHNWDEKVTALNLFKDELLFHIDLRWFAGKLNKISDFFKEISLLADTIMSVAHELALEKIKEQFNLKNFTPSSMLLALGKWGAREMGYASDVEFIFLYTIPEKSPHTTDHNLHQQLNRYYEKVIQCIYKIVKSKKNGIFEIDMRLRPNHPHSSWATSFGVFSNYYLQSTPQAYERLTLSRMRIIPPLFTLPSKQALLDREKVLQVQQQFVYSEKPVDLENYFSLRQAQIDKVNAETKGRINLKLSPGGLVDIEYLIQILSIHHGSSNPKVRNNNTQQGIKKLVSQNLITKEHALILRKNYVFMRGMINSLRIVRGNAKDLLIPLADSLELVYLERRVKSFKIINQKQNLLEQIKITLDEIKNINDYYLKKIKTQYQD